MEENEVKRVFKAYLDKIGIQYFVSKGAGPDFEFEDGSIAEVKGSEWADVGAILRQLAEYYLKSPSMIFVTPSDSLNLDRAFRLWMLECILKGMKREGKAIRVILVDKVADKKYKVYQFDSMEDLWREIAEKISSKQPRWYDPVDEKLSFISTFSSQEGNELVKLYIKDLVSERGSEIELVT
jgi:hypothetical protein